jgi:hypothetical protein
VTSERLEVSLRSPDRLRGAVELQNFCRYFDQHGALGGGGLFFPFTEEEKMSFLPMVFGLMPLAAVVDRRYDTLLKPAISRHLEGLQVEANDVLVSIIKSLCDQFWKSAQPTYQRQKSSIRDLRARTGLYRKIRDRQNGRCSICGISFDGTVSETLDHIVPFRLIGDVLNGANWQILCQECNHGKGANLSMYQMPEFLNWQYGFYENRASLPNSLRYSVLVRDGQCSRTGCGKTARERKLIVVRRFSHGMYVYDALETVCDVHLHS